MVINIMMIIISIEGIRCQCNPLDLFFKKKKNAYPIEIINRCSIDRSCTKFYFFLMHLIERLPIIQNDV